MGLGYNISFFFFFLSFMLFLKQKIILSMNFFLGLSVYLVFDFMSILFLSLLFMIVGSVFSFSSVYMEEEMFQNKFSYLLLSFVMSMVMLMLVPDFFFLLLGWDGLGLSSVLLIFFYQSKSSYFSAFKTFSMKRLGDGFIMVFLSTLFFSKSFFLWFWDQNIIFKMSMILIMGLITKSALFPFSSWLPAAMAAPTPVSSLVHSSTLVTAGIYLMMRNLNFLSPSLTMFLLVVGFWTLLTASLAACLEKDSKKLIAYSTLSQLGLMCMILSFNQMSVCFFHLLSHASFKALLFMISGYMMLSTEHHQDLRFFGGLSINCNYLLKTMFFLSVLSLSGLVFFSGFFSKDLFLEYLNFKKSFFFSFFLFLVVFLTMIYSFRLMISYFKKKLAVLSPSMIKYSLLSLLVLCIFSVVFGWFYSKMFLSSYSLHSSFNLFFQVLMGFLFMYWLENELNLVNNYFYFIFNLFFLKSTVWLHSASLKLFLFHLELDLLLSGSLMLSMTNYFSKVLNNLKYFILWNWTKFFFFFFCVGLFVLVFV